MSKMKIEDIENPDFLKEMKVKELEVLCEDIRSFLLASISKTGGHLSSNLGIIELTVAMHKVFNSPKDKFVWDVGHQAYVHKILTGRAKDFPTLRQFGGMSGFPDPKESPHDAFLAGHASTAISAGVGMVYARDLSDEDYEVVSVVGDGSLTGGMAFEGLNHIGSTKKRMIVIFNDNEMSISPNVGFISKAFSSFRRNRSYVNVERLIRRMLGKENVIATYVAKIKASVKQMILPELQPFEALGFKYFGPINGHNLNDLIKSLEYAKRVDEPIIIHVKTMKGKGFKPAEEDTDGSWHGVAPFKLEAEINRVDPKEKEENIQHKQEVSWSQHIANILKLLTEHDRRVAVITPAMIHGSALYDYLAAHPERLIDVGIAESHAVTMAAGMAIQGMKPFVSIYSTFIQRAYDQVSHDVCLQNLDVIFGVDRAGVTGADGKTHQGIYDISMLRHMPNMTIMMPKDAQEAYLLMFTAYQMTGPVAIRYPRGNVSVGEVPNYVDLKTIPRGKWSTVRSGTDAVIISYGPAIDKLVDLADDLAANGTATRVVNARFIKPLDEDMLDGIALLNVPVIVYEEAIKIGGLASGIMEYYAEVGKQVDIVSMGLPDEPIEHGDVDSVLNQHGLSMADVEQKIIEVLNK